MENVENLQQARSEGSFQCRVGRVCVLKTFTHRKAYTQTLKPL